MEFVAVASCLKWLIRYSFMNPWTAKVHLLVPQELEQPGGCIQRCCLSIRRSFANKREHQKTATRHNCHFLVGMWVFNLSTKIPDKGILVHPSVPLHQVPRGRTGGDANGFLLIADCNALERLEGTHSPLAGSPQVPLYFRFRLSQKHESNMNRSRFEILLSLCAPSV